MISCFLEKDSTAKSVGPIQNLGTRLAVRKERSQTTQGQILKFRCLSAFAAVGTWIATFFRGKKDGRNFGEIGKVHQGPSKTFASHGNHVPA